MIKFNADKNGYGDIALQCWYPDVCFYATKQYADLARLFGGAVTNDHTNAVTVMDCVRWEVRQGGSMPRIEARAKFFGLKEWRRPPAIFPDNAIEWAKIQNYDVLLFPEATRVCRQWSPNYWIDLASGLKLAGFKPVIITEYKEPAYRYADTMFQKPIVHIAALINRAKLTVGVDSAPCHIAGNLDRKAVCLLGPTKPTAFAHVPSVHCVTSDLSCTNCHWAGAWRKACSVGCASLLNLSVGRVLNKCREVIDGV